MCIFHILYIYNYTHVVLYGNIHIYMFVCICIYIYVHTHLFTYILSGSYHNIHSTLEWRHTKPFPHMLEKPTHTQILYETASFTQRSNHFKFLRTSCIHDHSHILYTHTYTHTYIYIYNIIYIILYIYNIIYICIYAWVWWFGHSNLSYIPTWSSTAQVFEGGSEVESAGRPSLVHAETITGL